MKRAPWTSRKLWSTLIAFALLFGIFVYSVNVLRSFDNSEDNLIAAYVQIYQTIMVSIGAVVLGYVGVTGVIQWRHGTEGAAANVSQTIETIERTFAPKHYDDPSLS